MTDLYEKLGVKKTANVKAVRSAYRAKAKKAHPDTGGNAEEFAALKQAHDILTDPVRRLKYDNTGDTSEKAPDNTMAQVVGELAQALGHVLMAIERKGGDPTEYQLVSDMKIYLGGKLDNVEKELAQGQAIRRKTEKLLGRFTVKSGENYLEGVITGKLAAIDSHLRRKEEERVPLKKALDILVNSSFRSNGRADYGRQSGYNLADRMNQAMYGV